MAKTKNKIPEGKLLKALAELEDSVEKGDALEDADPEGAFATEGTPLSDAAPSGRSDTKKAHGSDDDDESSDDDSSSTAKAFSASDMMSSKEAPAKKKSKKTEKAFPPPKAKAKDDDSSSDESSDDDDDGDDDSSAEKSFRDAVEQDETMSKAIEVSDFLEAMVDQLSLTMLKVVDSVQKSIVAMESRLNARIDNRVAKGISMSSDFNARLAKAITAIGTTVEEQADLVKSLSHQPAAAPRGKALLSKSDVNQPPWGGQGGGAMADGSDVDYGELVNIPADKIGDWLFAKSARNQLDPRLILAWEADHYNVETLPAEIRKALANDLLK